MLFLRNLTLIVFLLLISFICYMKFHSDTETKLNIASNLFINSQYLQSKKMIEQLKEELKPTEYYLYLSYSERSLYYLDESSKLLKEAEAAAEKLPQNSAILEEIYFNQALNGYLQNSPSAMTLPLKNLLNLLGKRDEKLDFFYALKSIIDKKEANASSILDNALPSFSLSPWMHASFDAIFTPLWLFIHQTKSTIAKGNFLKIRQKLQQKLKTASSQQIDELNWLIGLTFLKEAEEKTSNAATPYYVLAFSYFNRVPLNNEKFNQERQEVLLKFSQQIYRDLEQNHYYNLNFFIDALEAWQATLDAQKLKSTLIQHFDQKIEKNRLESIKEFSTALNRLVKDPKERQALYQKFNHLLNQVIQEGQVTAFDNYYEMALLFNAPHQKLEETMNQETIFQGLSLIEFDDANLYHLSTFLQFFLKNDPSPISRLILAEELISLAQYLGISNEQQDKAFALFGLAFSLAAPQDMALLQKKVSDVIIKNYELALKQENITALKAVLKAQKLFIFIPLVKREEEDKKTQLQLAEQLFANKKYEEAEKKAEWVLEIEPLNPSALYMAGMINYHKTLYVKTLFFLNKLKSSDKQVTQALAVSQLITGQLALGQAWFDQQPPQTFSAEIYKRLAFGSLENDHLQESLKWFSYLPQTDSEVLTGLAYIAFLQKKWSQALSYYDQLPLEFQVLNGMQTLALSSLIYSNQFSEAKQFFQARVQKSSPPSLANSSLSLPFKAFKISVLDPQTATYLAGLYAEELLGNFWLALESFSKIEPPTLQSLTQTGKILYTLGDTQQAFYILAQAMVLSRMTERAPIVKKETLILYAKTLSELGYRLESASVYREFFQSFPSSIEQRATYAEVLMEVQRYDQALEQYLLLEQAHLLTDRDRLNYVICLINTANFQSAHQKAKDWLKLDPPLSLANQLALAQSLLILKASSEIEKILERLPIKTDLSLIEQQALLALWMTQGDYVAAEQLIPSLKSWLAESIEGLILLATYYDCLADKTQAANYIHQALMINPDDYQVTEFLQTYQLSLVNLEEALSLIQKKLANNPTFITLNLDLAASLLSKALALNTKNSPVTGEQLIFIRQAYTIIDTLATHYHGIPRLYFLLGQALYFLDKFKEAEEAFGKTLNLDPAYSEASKYLSLTLYHLHLEDQAIECLQTALKFNPFEAEIWHLLAKLYSKNGNSLDAILALESSLKYKPNNAEGYLDLAFMRLQVKNLEGTKIALEKALKINPNQEEALTLLYKILYNPLLQASLSNSIEVKREETYQALHALNPKLAKQLFLELNGNSKDKEAEPSKPQLNE